VTMEGFEPPFDIISSPFTDTWPNYKVIGISRRMLDYL